MKKKPAKDVIDQLVAVERVPLEDLYGLQGTLKSLSEQALSALQSSLQRWGITSPVTAWRDGKGKTWILDGHQRVAALRKLQEGGSHVPDVPVALVHARSLREAQEQLLSLASTYGVATAEGVRAYLDGLGGAEEMPSLEAVHFPHLDLGGLFEDPAGAAGQAGKAGFNYKQQYAVAVICRDEAHQEQVFSELQAKGYELKVLVV